MCAYPSTCSLSPRGDLCPLLFNLGSIRVESMMGGILYDGHGEVISSMWLRQASLEPSQPPYSEEAQLAHMERTGGSQPAAPTNCQTNESMTLQIV